MTPVPSRLDFGPQLDVAVRSAVGAGPVLRPENQDNYLLIDVDGNAAFLRGQEPQRQRVPNWRHGHARVAVLDGMGGHGHGREAAEAVVAGLLTMPPCDTLGELSRRLDTLHASLQLHFADFEKTGLRPGTTLTMLELRAGQAPLLYHVGDSRLYEIGGDRVTPLTVDHVPATAFAMGGLLGEQEWWQQVHGEHRPQVAQAFILGNAFANPAQLSDPLFELTPLNLPSWLCHLPDRRALELRTGAAYLLATDGFWSCGDPYEFVGRWPELFRGNAEAMVDALFSDIEARPPAMLYPDNLTAVVLRPTGADETALPGQ
jgi:serine/threonine protein phosphatase PrpC